MTLLVDTLVQSFIIEIESTTVTNQRFIGLSTRLHSSASRFVSVTLLVDTLVQSCTIGIDSTHLSSLNGTDRTRIIRSQMFLKEKFLPSGVFEKLKARLVAGGDQQDKNLFEDLSSPTVSDNGCVSIIIYVYNPCLIILNLCLDTHVIYISLIS